MKRYSSTKQPKKGERKERGALSRALRNSDRMRGKFADKLPESLVSLKAKLAEAEDTWNGPRKTPDGKHAVSSAPQRFDSILEVLRLLSLNLAAVIEFLVEVVAEYGDGSERWAQDLLDLMLEEGFEALLPAVVEFMQICKKYVHRSEGHLSQSNLITAARDRLALQKELKQMFEADGGGVVPLCVSSRYTRGYYALVKQQLFGLRGPGPSGDVMFVTGAGAVPYHRVKKSLGQVAKEAAIAMKQLQCISALYLQLNEADHEVGRSMHPFHVESWAAYGDDARMEATLLVFADIADVKSHDLAEDIKSLRPFVMREVAAGTDLLEAWKKAAAAYADRAKALHKAMYPMICLFRGTGPLESRFHVGKVPGSKSNIGDGQLKNRMRIVVNGPSVEEFCSKKWVAGKVVYTPGPLCLLAQTLYAKEYGRAKFHAKKDPKQHTPYSS